MPGNDEAIKYVPLYVMVKKHLVDIVLDLDIVEALKSMPLFSKYRKNSAMPRFQIIGAGRIFVPETLHPQRFDQVSRFPLSISSQAIKPY